MSANIHEYWTQARAVSTMQRLQDANNKLRRRIAIEEAIAGVAIVAITLVALYRWAAA